MLTTRYFAKLKRNPFSNSDTQSNGCNGGSSIKAMEYARANGISSGNEYKFVAKEQPCQRTKTKYLPVYKWSKGACREVLNGDENRLKQMVATYGPVAVTVSKSCQLYC